MFQLFKTPLLAGGLVLLLAAGCQKKGDDAPAPAPTPTPPTTTPAVASQVALWLTTPDKSALFQRVRLPLNFGAPVAGNFDPVIAVDTTKTYQGIDGFGYTLTGGSAQLIHQLGAPARAALLKELFATDSTWLGVSYLRVSIGASDLSSQVFTYDDLPGGQTDVNMDKFSLGPDQTDLVPVLKEILAINPAIKIMGSPWTAPSWMKDNNSPINGSLKPEYYDAYAKYFVKYVQAMQAQGIAIDAVTLQNEPLNPYNNPSMVMQAAEQAAFIKNSVGPAFAAAGLSTKIICYDHNADRPDYPIAVLNDAGARPYVDGSAFHLYGGTIDALSTVHNAFPAKNIYFTEQYVNAPGNFPADLAWAVNNLVIGATRNWSRNVLEWNLAADAFNGPHTNGGCSTCLPAVTVGGAALVRNPSYYIIAHASKFVRPGSVRVDTNVPGNLQNVAFKTPNGKRALIVLNTGSALQAFNIQYKGKVLATSLAGGAVATYVW
ncbi:glycoside hydrolase family 30 protein [Hymenobacter nivis]|uniref:Glucosylceramidase n=1 Tax=Hymenobacter nivis TaxID=1850093 RepID=A0A502GU06_9BACT|nr:glycoside hydrolase family 30 beta sandwich domain-containing protein [Hymenobacter nivis]TPG65411.1 glucosylceramidase [Hymenobacter nivis]